MATIEVKNEQEYNAAIASGTVLVDFWAPWCGPCKEMSRILGVVDSKIPNIVIAKVDVEANPEFITKFGIKSIPVVLLFKDGLKVKEWIGQQKEQIFLEALK